MLHKKHIYGFSLLAIVLFIANVVIAQYEVLPYGWHRYFERSEAVGTSYAIEADGAGNVYIAGTLKSNDNRISRILQKYSLDGLPPGYLNDFQEVAFFQGDISTDYYVDFPFQKMVLDKTRKKLYILFAAKAPDDFDKLSFFLACHDMETGIKPLYWNGGVIQFVGESKYLRGGLDLDSNGNIWTVLEEEYERREQPDQQYYTSTRLKFKKWSGDNGIEIPIPYDGSILKEYSWLRFIAFGIRKTDNKMYIAYRKENINLYPFPYEEPVNLNIVLQSESFEHLGYKKIELENPITISENTYTNIGEEPKYNDGYVDSDGNFILGGYFYYDANHGDGIERNYYPIVLKLNSSLNEIFTFVSNNILFWQNKNAFPGGCNPYWDRISARVKSGMNKSINYSIVPMMWGGYNLGTEKILRLHNNGNFDVEHIFHSNDILDNIENTSNSNCYNWISISPFDFVYYTRFSDYQPPRERLIITGPVTKQPCNIAYPIGTISFFDKGTFSGPAEIKSGEFNWRDINKISHWIKENDPPIIIQPEEREPWFWEPNPEPFPCPECFFSMSALNVEDNIPSYLENIYKHGYAYLGQINKTEFPDILTNKLINVLENIPLTDRFRKTNRETAIQLLRSYKNTEQEYLKLSQVLIEIINKVDLDWRVPEIKSQKIIKGKNKKINFNGIACLNFEKALKQTECSLNVESGLPASAENFDTGYPVATYNFKLNGSIKGYVDLSVYFGGIRFFDDMNEPRLLEWNGKNYIDITKSIDRANNVITGRTKNLKSYVILNKMNDNK